jgi:hypothetical protein
MSYKSKDLSWLMSYKVNILATERVRTLERDRKIDNLIRELSYRLIGIFVRLVFSII